MIRVLRLVLLVALVAGCGTETPPEGEAPEELAGDPRAELVEIPRPSTETFEERVREQLLTWEAELDQALADEEIGDEELARAFGELGRRYQVYELYDAAAASYTNAHRLDPDHFPWAHLLGVVEQGRGHWNEAAAAFARALEIRPDNAPARVRRGQVLMELGREEEARRAFDAALEQDPDVALARYFLGQMALQAQDWQAAAGHFESVKTLQPEASVIHYPLSRAYQGLGRADEARSEVEKIGSEEVRLADPLVAALPRLSAGAASFVRRAARAQVDGQFDQAVIEYRRALEADPENVEARIGLGGVLAELGRVDEALEEIRRALEIDDSQLQARYNLAGLLRMKGESKEAVAAYRRALELDDEHLPSRLGLARALRDTGDLDAAAEAYRRAIEVEEAPRALLEWATLEAGRGNLERALELQQKALAADLPETVQIGVRLRRARWLLAVGRIDDAVAQYDAVLAVADRSADESVVAGRDDDVSRSARADAHLGRANLRGARGDYLGAAEDYAHVVELDPARQEAWLGRGTALALAGQWLEARQTLESGLDAVPDNPDLSLALARILATAPVDSVRDGERALVLARRVLDQGGGLEVAETVGMALAELGRWQEAVQWQEQIVGTLEAAEGLPAAEKASMLQRSRALLEQYRNGEPVRQ